MDAPFVISRTSASQTAARTLRETDLFGSLGDAEIAALGSIVTRRRVPRRGLLFHQGDVGISLFVVERGSIHCHLVTEDGRELTVGVFGRGEVVGELAFLDGHGRSASATALSDSELWVLARDDFYRFIRRYPEAAPHVLARLSERFRRAYDDLRRRSFASTEARLAERLIDLMRVHGRLEGDGVLIATRATQGQLAELIGRSRVTVNKTLADFEARGLVRRIGHRILVLDPNRLEEVAHEDVAP